MPQRVISEIYAAATGRLDWDVPLKHLASRLDCWAVQVIGIDKASGAVEFHFFAGTAPPAFALDYLRFYHAVNPLVAPVMAGEVGEWAHDHELFDAAFVAGHPFFRDFLLPHGGRHIAGTKLVDEDDAVVLLVLFRAAGARPLGPADMPAVEPLAYHLAEALHNHLHVGRRFGDQQIPKHLLDPFPQAMLLVDDALGIVQRNAAADRLLAARDPLVERGGRLVCKDPECAVRVSEAIDELRRTADDPLRQRRLVRLPRRNLPDLMLFVSAVRPENSMRAFGTTVRFLMIAHDPLRELDTAHDPLLLAECFGLTPAEARIAVALAAGFDVKEIAQRHRTSVHTVRSQLRAVLVKTGTNRQADLIRLLLSLPGNVS
ncbi:MAG: helix-turn-helix transcriptional regulator [Burkholderiales bacterium]|nr:helix-turn-helix transcriptional regulator [Burkholderiales bacterium]